MMDITMLYWFQNWLIRSRTEFGLPSGEARVNPEIPSEI